MLNTGNTEQSYSGLMAMVATFLKHLKSIGEVRHIICKTAVNWKMRVNNHEFV